LRETVDAGSGRSNVQPVAQPSIEVVPGAPAAVCRVCAAAVRLDTASADALSAHVRRFMDAHHHDAGSDIVIDISEISDETAG
jgi:hypothetical protein